MRELIKINEAIVGREELDAVTEVFKTGVLSERSGSGPKVLEFEGAFAKSFGVKHAIAVSSGTAALHAALLAADVKAGDEVVVPSFTYVATVNAVLLAGARPIFADIDEETYCVRSDSVEDAVSRKTKAIIPVHLYGLPAEMKSIMEIAGREGIPVIADAAQAHGATYNDKNVACTADMTCFSFYGSKNMTTGEGGMVVTDDEDYAESLRVIRMQGEERPNWVVKLGHNYCMSEVAAAIGVVQLRKLLSFLEKRRENSNLLSEALRGSGRLALPKEPEGMQHAWNLYTVRLKGANAGRRAKVVEKLMAKNIEAIVYYETPVHMLPYYKQILSLKRGLLPATERASRQVFSLPIHPKVSGEDIEYMASSLKKVVA